MLISTDSPFGIRYYKQSPLILNVIIIHHMIATPDYHTIKPKAVVKNPAQGQQTGLTEINNPPGKGRIAWKNVFV